MKRLTVNRKVRIDQDLDIKLRLEASNRRLNVSDIIRDALYEYVMRPGSKAAKAGKNAHK